MHSFGLNTTQCDECCCFFLLEKSERNTWNAKHNFNSSSSPWFFSCFDCFHLFWNIFFLLSLLFLLCALTDCANSSLTFIFFGGPKHKTFLFYSTLWITVMMFGYNYKSCQTFIWTAAASSSILILFSRDALFIAVNNS